MHDFIQPTSDPKSPSTLTPRTRDLDELSGIEFERLIARLLQNMGFRTQTTKATGDGGIDHRNADRPIVAGRYLIQCKRYAVDTPVSAPKVREFYGALVYERAIKGVFITTSGFTADAKQYAKQVGIELIERTLLKQMLAENGLNRPAARQIRTQATG